MCAHPAVLAHAHTKACSSDPEDECQKTLQLSAHKLQSFEQNSVGQHRDATYVLTAWFVQGGGGQWSQSLTEQPRPERSLDSESASHQRTRARGVVTAQHTAGTRIKHEQLEPRARELSRAVLGVQSKLSQSLVVTYVYP